MEPENTKKKLVLVLWQLFLLLIVAIPDAYLGIADAWFLPVAICSLCLLRSKIEYTPTIRFIVFLLLYHILSITISLIGYGSVNTGYLLSYVLWIFLFLASLNIGFSIKDVKALCTSYILSGAIIAFLILFQRVDFFDSDAGSRYTIQILGHEKFDPNFLAATMVVPFILSVTKQLYNYTLWNLICLLLIGLGVLFTSSRGSMISCCIGAVTAIIVYTKKNGNLKSIVIVTVTLLMCFFIIIYFLPQASYDRLFSNSYNDSSNARRFLDWSTGLRAFKKNWLLGYGMVGELEILRKEFGVHLIAHNTYIALLMQYGVLGCSFLFWGVAMIIRKAILYKDYIVLSIIISTLFVVFFISAEVCVFLWMPLILVSIILQNIQLRYDENVNISIGNML